MNGDLKKLKKEFIFYYESRQNPNGDPGFENQPRTMPDGTIIVTDVRVKRTIRDYAKSKHNKKLFVDNAEDGKPTTADDRAKELLGDLKGDVIKGLIKETYDVPLFGGLVTVRSPQAGEGGSYKLTGPVQFGIGRSVNKVRIINPLITGRFVGAKKKKESGEESEEQSSTFGKFYSVEYALIKIQGAVNPTNLGSYLDDPDTVKKFNDCEDLLMECLWNGTNNLITRSKFPQRSIFFFEVTYKSAIFNDLPLLISDNEKMKGLATELCANPLSFEKVVPALKERTKKIDNIRVAACRELKLDAETLVEVLKKNGLPAVLIGTEDPQW